MRGLLFIPIFLSYHISICQVKLWNSDLNKVKTKGTYLTVNKEIKDVKLQSDQYQIFGIFPATTVAGAILPFAFQYANSALKNLTARDEKDYFSENISINSLSIPFKEFKDDSVIFNAELKYFAKGTSKSTIASKYIFSINLENYSLIVSLNNTNGEKYLPIKSKINYDFIIETFDITIQAELHTKINDSIQRIELRELGTTKITRTLPSFTQDVEQIFNKGMVFFPKNDNEGNIINIENIILTCKITYLNPVGVTNSSLNKFLENNSDINESLFKAIFIKSKD